jgi:hypothetical protein
MSFIQRELNRISAALLDPLSANYDQLYAAQQALSWALEPNGFKSPYDTIKGTPEGVGDCLSSSCPLPSSDNHGSRV